MRSHGLSIHRSIAIAHSSTERMRWLNSTSRLRLHVPDRSEDLLHVGRVDLRGRPAADAGKVCRSLLRHQSRVPPGRELPERPCGDVATHGPLAAATTTSGDPGQRAAQGGDRSIPPGRPHPPGGRERKIARAVRAFPCRADRGKGQPRGADSRDSRASVSPGARQGPPEHQARRQSTDASCWPGTTSCPRSTTTPQANPGTGLARNETAGSRSSRSSGATRHKSHSNRHMPLNSKVPGANPETCPNYPATPAWAVRPPHAAGLRVSLPSRPGSLTATCPLGRLDAPRGAARTDRTDHPFPEAQQPGSSHREKNSADLLVPHRTGKDRTGPLESRPASTGQNWTDGIRNGQNSCICR